MSLTPGDESAVAAICRRLDGLPLAIELAAARVTVLSVGQIVGRLNDRFELLTSGGRATLARHQTLRAALDWSYELLTGPERATLRALSVFAGGFTLEAAEIVCAGAGAEHDAVDVSATDVLDLVARLVDKSLVVAEEQDGPVRYRLLETVRQYAAERLAAGGEAQAARERQAAWCLELAEAVSAHQTGPDQVARLERLAVEHDNIRAVLGWCLAGDGDPALGLRLGGAVWWLWEVRGHLGEGRHWLEALLDRGGDAPPNVRATALNGAAVLAGEQGDHDAAVRLHEKGLALRRQVGDEAGVAGSLNNLGIVLSARGDHAEAEALFEESLVLLRKLGDRRNVANTLMNVGLVTWRRGEFDRAVALYEESLAALRELGDKRGVATALLNLGNVLRDQGAFDDAVGRYGESLLLHQELQDPLGVAHCLQGIAMIAGRRGDAARSARLCGAIDALRAAIGAPHSPSNRVAFERTLGAARASLGEDAFAAAWAAGEGLSLEDAAAEALADPPPI